MSETMKREAMEMRVRELLYRLHRAWERGDGPGVVFWAGQLAGEGS